MDEIREDLANQADLEGQTVLQIISLASRFTELRSQIRAERRWERTVIELGVSPRVACRYLCNGQSWWVEHTPDSGILPYLPCDLHKLVELCKLSPEQLDVHAKGGSCKERSRNEVQEAVQSILSASNRTPREAASVETLRKQLTGCVKRLVDVLDDLTDHEIEEEDRHTLWEELQNKFAEVRDALGPVPESEDHSEETGRQTRVTETDNA